MQWQHPEFPGPPPPKGLGGTETGDPLDCQWRRNSGWELKIIGLESKTLVEAQRNYPAFDKEAGGVLICVRKWADLITYHPTVIYTDSSVATSMLTKHAAPPRLQRWGMELGTYLPHLRISYRKGQDNGLPDLLSRFPAFKRYHSLRTEEIELPEEDFEYVGSAPLFLRTPSARTDDRAQGLDYLQGAEYRLYEPRRRHKDPHGFWHDVAAPEIPVRTLKDRVPRDQLIGFPSQGSDEAAPSFEGAEKLACAIVALIKPRYGGTIIQYDQARSPIDVFHATCLRAPQVRVTTPDGEPTDPRLTRELQLLGMQVHDEKDPPFRLTWWSTCIPARRPSSPH